MGLIRKSSLKNHWNLRDLSQSTQIFSLIFTRDRFFLLQSMLLFPECDGETVELKIVEYIVIHLSEQFRFYYMPKKGVSTDKSLIGLEGQASAFQCRPNKHHNRFGFKPFVYMRVILATH